MARRLFLVSSPAASSAAQFEAAINAALAPLLSDTIGGWDVTTTMTLPAYVREFRGAIDTETGGTVIASPYQVKVIEADTPDVASSLAATFIAANPTFFFAPSLFRYTDQIPNVRDRCLYFLFYNQSAADGAANWNPGYVPAGITAANVGNTLYVDAVFGNNATALPDRADKPYLTIEAAVAAASSGDTVMIRPGTYTPATGLFKDGISIYADPNVVINYNITLFSTSSSNVTFRFTGYASFIASGAGSRFLSTGGGATGQTVVLEFLEHSTTAANNANGLLLNASGQYVIRCTRSFIMNCATAIFLYQNSVVTSSLFDWRIGQDLQNTGAGDVIQFRQGSPSYIEATRIIAGTASAISSSSGGTPSYCTVVAQIVQGGSSAINMNNGYSVLVRTSSIIGTAGPAILASNSGATLNCVGVRTIQGTTACVSLSAGTVQVNSCDTMTASAGTALSVTGGTLNITGVRTITGTTGVLNLSTGTVTTAGGENWTASGGACVTVSGGTLNMWNAGIISGTTAGITTSGGTITALAVTITASSGSGVAITSGSGTVTITATTIQATGGNNAGVNQSGGSGTYIISQARIVGIGNIAAARRDVATGNLVFANCVFLAPAGAANGISATGATNIVFNTPCTANKALAGTITALVTTPTVSASAI